MNKKIQIIEVQNISISISKVKDDDFICLTDMAKAKEGDARAADIIKNWIRNRYTLEFLGTWEQMYNPNFKVVEFDHFKMQAGLPSFVLSPGQWVEKTNAVKQHIIPKSDVTRRTEWIAYADEADLLNVALFGCTAKQWREVNSSLALENKNIRDFASINELTVLSNLESLNAEMIKTELNKSDRFQKMLTIATYQLNILNKTDFIKSLKKTNEDIYLKSGDDKL